MRSPSRTRTATSNTRAPTSTSQWSPTVALRDPSAPRASLTALAPSTSLCPSPRRWSNRTAKSVPSAPSPLPPPSTLPPLVQSLSLLLPLPASMPPLLRRFSSTLLPVASAQVCGEQLRPSSILRLLLLAKSMRGLPCGPAHDSACACRSPGYLRPCWTSTCRSSACQALSPTLLPWSRLGQQERCRGVSVSSSKRWSL